MREEDKIAFQAMAKDVWESVQGTNAERSRLISDDFQKQLLEGEVSPRSLCNALAVMIELVVEMGKEKAT